MKQPKLHEIKNTPFLIVEMKKGELHIAVGNNFVTEKTFKTKAEAVQYINTKPYDLIINSCILILQTYEKVNTNKESNTSMVEETQSK